MKRCDATNFTRLACLLGCSLSLAAAGQDARAIDSHADTARTEPPRDTSAFVWQGSRDAGAAILHSPYGGEYVYSQGESSDGRTAQRFVLGKPVRTEFSLFSAKEEEALWALRQERIQASQVSVPAHRATHTPRRLALDWPKVVVEGNTTCVPEAAFSEAPDWKSHLVCWMANERQVRREK